MPAASGGCSKEECLDLNFGRNAVLWIGVVLLLFGLFNLFQGSTRGPQPDMPELSNLPMGGGLRQAAHPPKHRCPQREPRKPLAGTRNPRREEETPAGPKCSAELKRGLARPGPPTSFNP